MSEYKVKISGDNAGGLRSINETHEAMTRLRGGTENMARALSGDLVGGLAGAAGALRGLGALVVANPWVALAAGIGLVVGKLISLKSEAGEAAAASLQKIEDRVLSLRKALGDLSAMNPAERISYLAGKKDVEGLRSEVSAARQEESLAFMRTESAGADGTNAEAFAKYREARLLRQLAEKRLAEAMEKSAEREEAGNSGTAGDEADRLLAAIKRQDAAARAEMARRPLAEQHAAAMKELQNLSAIEQMSGEEGTARREEMKAAVAEKVNEVRALQDAMDRERERAEAEKKRADEAAQDKAEREAEQARKEQERADADVIAQAEDAAREDTLRERRSRTRGSADYLQDVRDSIGARGMNRTHTPVTKDQQQRDTMIRLLEDIKERSGLAP